MDKEYIVLDEISVDPGISQRLLAEKTGLSLGSINLLMKKMVREGLVKIENIPANRVAYMLTPKGMAEKANKTYRYIKHHYTYLHQTKERIKDVLVSLDNKNERVIVILKDDEISQLVQAALDELKPIHIQVRTELTAGDDIDGIVVVLDREDFEKYTELGCKVVHLMELL